MSVRSLSSGAEACIARAMELDGDEAEAVRSYVLKQTNTDNFCEMFVYRIVEFVKSFFGASDYQTCKAIIFNHFMSRMIEEGVIEENPENRLEIHLNRRSSEFFSMASKRLLNLALLAQKHNSDFADGWRNVRFSYYKTKIADLRVRLSQ